VYRFNTETGARSVLLRGDFDKNGVVNAADLALWKSSFEEGPPDGADADADGDSDGADFLGWQRGLGNQATPGLFSPSAVVVYDAPAAALVPEPGAAALLAAVLALAPWSRRSGRRPVAAV
jgi:hypothetical protein